MRYNDLDSEDTDYELEIERTTLPKKERKQPFVVKYEEIQGNLDKRSTTNRQIISAITSSVPRKGTTSSLQRNSTHNSSIPRNSTNPSSIPTNSTNPSSIPRNSTNPINIPRNSTSPSIILRNSSITSINSSAKTNSTRKSSSNPSTIQTITTTSIQRNSINSNQNIGDIPYTGPTRLSIVQDDYSDEVENQRSPSKNRTTIGYQEQYENAIMSSSINQSKGCNGVSKGQGRTPIYIRNINRNHRDNSNNRRGRRDHSNYTNRSNTLFLSDKKS